MNGVAVNVGANTNEPGFRGPIYPDGRFEFVPIPESEPTDGSVPTYADLPLETDVSSVADRPVHFDPEFPELGGERYTYGDPYGVKARPLSSLSAGEYVFFYATLSPEGTDHPAWVPPDWGAFLVGHFRLARDPVSGDEYAALSPAERAPFASNAHVRRTTFDARVLLSGDPEDSTLYDVAVPLSRADAGAAPNRLVTELSDDSGKGPWWRRPLRFDGDATAALLSIDDPGEASF